MPITKQVKKRAKQAKVRTARNKHYSSRMKSMIKLILGYAQKKEVDKANKILPKVISSIDICAKKNIIHKNNAARKKSSIQRALSGIGKKVEKPASKKAEVKEEKVEKKDTETPVLRSKTTKDESSGEKKEVKKETKKK